MDEGLPSVSIFAFFVILVMDIIMYGFSASLEHASKEEIEKKSAESRDGISERLLKLLDDQTVHIQSMQLFSVITNMVLGGFVAVSIGGYLARRLGTVGNNVTAMLTTVLTGVLIAVLILCFGIMLPARLAGRTPVKWLYACFYPTTFLKNVLYPVVMISGGLERGILYIFGIRGDDNLSDVTEEEIKSMVSEGQEQGLIQESEADMITNIFEFSDKEAQDIMTNRNAMVAIDANVSLKEAVGFMLATNNSRFPVYLEDIDHIIGIMHIRDAMKKLSEETDKELPIKKIKGLLRQPKFVPETRKIDSLFHSMQSSKTQMVIVIDEYGQTAGLVSMEDILEEIVGNIMDEYDEDENFIKPTKTAGQFTADGKTPIEVLEKRFKISFEETEFETLNGYLISRLDRIPEQDENFDVTVEGYNFKILSVSNHMVASVLITKLPPKEETEDEVEVAK